MDMRPLKTRVAREYLAFLVHILVSAAIFVLILGVTIAISYVGDFLVRMGMANRFMIYALDFLEYFLFGVNIVLF